MLRSGCCDACRIGESSTFRAKTAEGNNELSFSDRNRKDKLADAISRVSYGRQRDAFYDGWKMNGRYRGCRSSERSHHAVDPDYLPRGREFHKWGQWIPYDAQEEDTWKDRDY